MNAITSAPFTTNQTARLIAFFPNADAQVVSVLATHGQALPRYLTQTYELTLAETIEAIDAFFLEGVTRNANPKVA
ncbi:MAG: hypothetical protein HKP37_00425 [Boseongicola sp.]|nr:hypothetical protein [Boseongicola sp.]